MGLVEINAQRWPNGVVPFELRGGFKTKYIPGIMKAIDMVRDELAAHTAIRLREKRPGDRNWVSFTDYWILFTWSAYTGRKLAPGWQDINIHDFTNRLLRLGSEAMARTLIHELGHALGLIHEHQRFDRDNFVSRIGGGSDIWNYGIRKHGNEFTVGAYDCDSVMHYVKQFEGKGGRGCPEGDPGTLRHNLSSGDIDSINFLYPIQTRGSVLKWRSNWVCAPFQLSNRPFCFWYMASTGTIAVSELINGGERVTWMGRNIFTGNKFSKVITIQTTDGSETTVILLYDRFKEQVFLLTISSIGEVSLRAFIPNSGHWTHLESFMRNGKQHILAYNQGSGKAVFFQVSPDAKRLHQIWYLGHGRSWRRGWSRFNFFELDGEVHLLSYINTNTPLDHSIIKKSVPETPGISFSGSIFNQLTTSSSVNTKSWIQFGTYEYSGETYLFLVREGGVYVGGGGGFGVNVGNISFDSMDKLEIWHLGNGFSWTLIGITPWSRDWDTFIPYGLQRDNSTQLLFLAYNSTNGFAQFGKIYADRPIT